MSNSSKSAVAVGAPIPMLDLKRQYATIREETQAAIARVCESQQLILGDEAAAFEREASAFLGVKETVACASGTDALWLMLQAASIGPGDRVVTTPFSFFASASAIVRAGARPVFADIEPDTLNLDPVKVAELLEDSDFRIKGILPVHLYGQCAHMDRFASLESEHKVKVFEDAAQAFGATWRGRRAGGLGIAAAFSFYPTKNLSAFGDAGCVTTNDAAIAARVRSLRNHGSTQRYYHDEIGWNARMDAIQAAVLRVKLKHLPEWNTKRREIAERYDELFVGAGLSDARMTRGTDSAKPVRLLTTLPENVHIFHQYVIRVEKRDELRKFLSERAIGSEIYYPVPLHLQKTFTYLGYLEGDFPEAERATKEVLALPIFPELTDEEQKRVVAAIAEFYS